MLWELGTTGVAVACTRQGRLRLSACFPASAGPGQDEALCGAVVRAVPAARIEPTELPEVDWVARFREGFAAFDVGGFRIVPAWQREEARGARHPLYVEPGQAFGTGTHESTRLCLRALESLAAESPLDRVVDLGTGSGILAIAALRLGSRLVVASDLDPEALSCARLHARLNDTPLPLVLADGGRAFRPHSFDLALANLSAPLLVERAGEIAALAPRRVLAGLLVDDLPAVRTAFARFGPLAERHDGEWAALVSGLP